MVYRRFAAPAFLAVAVLLSVLLCVFLLHVEVFAETEDSWLLGESSGETDIYDEFADLVLAAVVTDDMSDVEKCRAVYDFVHGIPYVNTVYSEDWKENGYHMLFDRQGDCFGYYSASRLLLERLGYQVIELQNINGFTHVWCLVSIDHGQTWWHFDPTCWSWGSDGYLCLVSDEELIAYGQKHQVGWNQLSHDWDRQQAAAEIQTIRASLAIQDAHDTQKVWIVQEPEEQKTVEVYVLYQEDDFSDADEGVSTNAESQADAAVVLEEAGVEAAQNEGAELPEGDLETESSVVTRRSTRAEGDSQG